MGFGCDLGLRFERPHFKFSCECFTFHNSMYSSRSSKSRERGCEKKPEPSGTSARPVLVLLPAASSKLHSGVLGGRKSRGCSRDHAAGVTVTRGVRRGSMWGRGVKICSHIFFISLFHRISSESDFQNDIFM